MSHETEQSKETVKKRQKRTPAAEAAGLTNRGLRIQQAEQTRGRNPCGRMRNSPGQKKTTQKSRQGRDAKKQQEWKRASVDGKRQWVKLSQKELGARKAKTARKERDAKKAKKPQAPVGKKRTTEPQAPVVKKRQRLG